MQTVSPHAHYFSKNYNNVKITQKFVVRKPKHQILYNIIFMILSCKCKCQETAGHDNNDMSNKIDALSPIPTPVVFLGFILSSEKGFNNPHLFELVETSSVWFPVFSLLLHSRNLPQVTSIHSVFLWQDTASFQRTQGRKCSRYDIINGLVLSFV